MAAKVQGDERRGQDDDEGSGPNVKKVTPENRYFDKLRERLGTGTKPEAAPATAEPVRPSPGIIYGDDGHPIK